MAAADNARLSSQDPNSYANLDDVKVLDVALKLDVDFGQHVLDGAATLTVERVRKGAEQLVSKHKGLFMTLQLTLIFF